MLKKNESNKRTYIIFEYTIHVHVSIDIWDI